MTFLSRYAAAASWKAGQPSLSGTYPDWAQNIAGFDVTPDIQSASSPLTFSITSGALPAGLTLDTSTGRIHGTPTDTPATYNFNLHLVDNRGLEADLAGSILIGTFWTPANLANATKFWYDELSSVTNVSGAASQWNDRSANAIHVAQGTAGSRPAINASNAEVNNVRTLTFDGTNDYMFNNSATAKALYKNIATGWMMSVHKKAASARTSSLAIYVPVPAGATRIGIAVSNGSAQEQLSCSGRRDDANSTAGVSAGATEYGDQWVMVIGLLNYAARTADIHINGSHIAQATGLWSAGAATSNTDAATNALTLGTNNIASGSWADMVMAAALGSSGASLPSATEIDKLFGWAAWKYAFQTKLPLAHTYRSKPPIV